MNVIIGKLCHCLHHHRKPLHARHILDDIEFGSPNRHVSEEMKKQIVAGANSVNIAARRILSARISRDHDVTVFFGVNQFPGDVTLNNFMREVLTHLLATHAVDFKALLQSQTAIFQADVHQACTREISVGENGSHG